jgi:hypothetical protein
MTGCAALDKTTVSVTPTPEPTATPTPVPVTPTPMPTSTPAPRLIGTKTSTSSFVYLTNNLGGSIREVYLKVADTEDWGKNLVPSEASIRAAEQVQLHYSPESSEDTYDLKFITRDGSVYILYKVKLTDMEKASLSLDGETPYLRYTSLTDNSEVDTRETGEASSTISSSGTSSSDEAEDADSSGDSSDEDWEVYYYDNDDYDNYNYDYNDYDYDDYDYNDYNDYDDFSDYHEEYYGYDEDEY